MLPETMYDRADTAFFNRKNGIHNIRIVLFGSGMGKDIDLAGKGNLGVRNHTG